MFLRVKIAFYQQLPHREPNLLHSIHLRFPARRKSRLQFSALNPSLISCKKEIQSAFDFLQEGNRNFDFLQEGKSIRHSPHRSPQVFRIQSVARRKRKKFPINFSTSCKFDSSTLPHLRIHFAARRKNTAHNIRSATMSLLSISHHPIVPLPSLSCLGQFPRHILKLCRYRSGRLLWMRNMPHSFNERLRGWSLSCRTSMLSHASGCTPSSTIPMAPSLAIRRVSWLKDSLKPTVLITLRPSLLWLTLAPSVSSFPFR